MVMTWNAEADAKLFQGVLNLLRDSKIKLDYEYLAGFMGPDCLPGAVQNRIVRLKRMAEKGANNEDPASGGDINENPDGAVSESPAQASPAKRKGGRPKGVKGSPAKKVKAAANVKVEEGKDEAMQVDGDGEVDGGDVA
ncbi:hypothetical protein BJX62DRAFT_235950 [Aspergillus germanicus]